MDMSWQEVSLILGVMLILVGAAIKIFKKNNGDLKLPPEFYDVKTQVGEQEIRFEEFKKLMDEKITNLSESVKNTNDKIDKLTELLIKYISEN